MSRITIIVHRAEGGEHFAHRCPPEEKPNLPGTIFDITQEKDEDPWGLEARAREEAKKRGIKHVERLSK